MKRALRVGTRGSRLALAQAGQVAKALSVSGEALEVDLVPIKTSGDLTAASGDKSRFVKEIEQALIDGDVDLAVHSAKDLPGIQVEGLDIAAVPRRADARDVFIGAAESLEQIGSGARIGTSSIRRKSQLLSLQPDLVISSQQGNIDTRIKKYSDGNFDGIVLAAAGLKRLGLDQEVGFYLEIEDMVPAPGQGALVVQARDGDDKMHHVAEKIGDPEALKCLLAERAVARELNASCNTPLGAHATLLQGSLTLSVFLGAEDGKRWIRDRVSGSPDEAVSLAKECAKRLVSAGAMEILGSRPATEAVSR